MSRFDRDKNASEGPSGSLGVATDELKSSLDLKVRELVEAAEARAAEIEDSALRKAAQVERESEERAQDTLKSAAERTERALEAIQRLSGQMSVVMSSLKKEVETLAAEIESARRPPAKPPQDPESPTRSQNGSAEATAEDTETEAPAEPEAEPDPQPAGQAEAATATEPERPPEQPAEPEPATEPAPEQPQPAGADVAPGPNVSSAADEAVHRDGPEAREVIRAQITTMFRAGKSRAEAERFVVRFFQDGVKYVDVLDEVYGAHRPSPPNRQRSGGLFRRRR